MDLSNAPSSWDIERERLAALSGYAILDTPPEREYDVLTRVAAVALNVQSAAISLIDGHRQWFKSRHGIAFPETPRAIAFCSHALKARSALVVPDARQDTRFRDNPLVTSEGGIRFYASVPLITQTGLCLGTLCVFDPAPRERLDDDERLILEDLAQHATSLIEARCARRMTEIAGKVVDATSDAVLAADLSGRIVHWNAAAEQMFGRSRGEAIGEDVSIIMPPRFVHGHTEAFGRAAQGGPTRLVGSFIELVAMRADGSEFPIELSLARWGDPSGDQGFAAIVRDISARKSLEREREHAQKFLQSIVSNLPATLFVKDVETRRYLMINHAGETVMGRPASEIIGATDHELFPANAEASEDRDNEAIARRETYQTEAAFTRGDGETLYLRTMRTVIDGPDRPCQYLLGVSEDVTQIRRTEAEVLRLAHYDALTGLLNRSSYTDRLFRMVQAREPFAMLSIDLDRFKAVNDQFGHPGGDAVLIQVGDRLRAVIEGEGWIARIGGDEFIAVLAGERLRERAQMCADRLIDELAKPIVTGRGVCYIGASVGIVLMPQDGETTEQLRENVDLALYRAKHNGRACACFFNAEMDSSARDRRQIERDLREAVAAGDIGLVYQPLVAAQTGRITSAEALARWTHPVKGPIRPDVFIALAEECGIIDQLAEQLLRQACVDARNWPADVRVAVNLSPLQFVSGKLVETVGAALAASGLCPSRLQLEVTEGLVIRDVERTFDQLEALRSLGIQILIDDFGVGYSSLSYFQRFPFDKVKLDRSFVEQVTQSQAARAIIQAVVGLGAQLGMAVVAEGVETHEQMEALVAMGCTHLQGYLFSRPLPVTTLCAMLESQRSVVPRQDSQAA
ncbi:hypothetical protein LH128_12308 [Sphingomonas sp. LH128]|nr:MULTISPECIES: EAL domain-containing protein [Sphingomonadaceae]EJU12739.1 hypothetical protein LH128_12308 [Sphingomonas sp. LH128]NYI24760.1 diguanylate cyclase (GGDEF)-like protein/PAS domain S-box-containing protein [Sphingobium indicum]BBF72584.1 hypothetical protein SBA_pBAR3_1510 [Sphingomonas bisphenolicum]